MLMKGKRLEDTLACTYSLSHELLSKPSHPPPCSHSVQKKVCLLLCTLATDGHVYIRNTHATKHEKIWLSKYDMGARVWLHKTTVHKTTVRQLVAVHTVNASRAKLRQFEVDHSSEARPAFTQHFKVSQPMLTCVDPVTSARVNQWAISLTKQLSTGKCSNINHNTRSYVH